MKTIGNGLTGSFIPHLEAAVKKKVAGVSNGDTKNAR